MQHRQEAPGIVAGIHDIEEMLKVGSSDDLAQWLAQRLGERLPKARLRVLRIYPGRAARLKEKAGLGAYCVLDITQPRQPGVPVSLDATLLEAIRSRTPLKMVPVPGGARLLARLGGSDVRYLIELAGPIPLEAPGAEASQLVSLVATFFERLVDAETDPVTRLSDRRVLHAHIESSLKLWAESGRPHFFAILDIDHFKRINDGFGHLYGDEILVLFANLMRSTFRAGDLLYRFGGEEFLVIYGVEPGHGGERAVERFRAAVEAYAFPGVGQVTMSGGFARIDALTPAALLIDRADQAVYYAKAHGRNRVCSWETLIAAGELQPKATANKDVTLF